MAVGIPAQAHQCGCRNHATSECKFKTTTCDRYSKVGHIAPICRSGSKSNKKPATRKTKWVATTEPSHTLGSQEHLCVISNKSTAPYKVQLEVKEKLLTMEVAAVYLVLESAVESLLSSSELQPSNIILKFR